MGASFACHQIVTSRPKRRIKMGVEITKTAELWVRAARPASCLARGAEKGAGRWISADCTQRRDETSGAHLVGSPPASSPR